jgi:hypothetical protein
MNQAVISAMFLLHQASPTAPDTRYEPSVAHPYGQSHPEAPAELDQFAFFVGAFSCTDRRLGPDGEWIEFPAIWNGHYFMNGHAIQDQYWAPGFYTSNIRQYDESDGLWRVSFFSEPNYASGSWTGGVEQETIVLTREIAQPDGSTIVSRLTFSEIEDGGFFWAAASETDSGWRDSWTSRCLRQ